MEMKKQKVLLGMSGGVDSSVAAVLLLEQGYEVIGAFMKNWSDGNEGEECSWRVERRDAQRVAARLGIEFYTFDFEDQYRAEVYDYMIREYRAGRTPNPDVLCNKYMKFGYLMKEADRLNCDFVATGHYARKTVDEHAISHLLSGVDANKDQSYFLCQLSQVQLSRVLFPIGDLEKNKVREIAKMHGLEVANKKDSQGICFVGKVQMREFLKEKISEQEGNIVTTSGEVLGKHKGHAYYTIGQRTGLGIGGGIPYFIVERRPETNEIVVAVGEDDPALFKADLVAEELSETVEGHFARYEGETIFARIRYRQPLQECRFVRDGDRLRVSFTAPQRAVAPGQFVVFYVGDELIGSGVISV